MQLLAEQAAPFWRASNVTINGGNFVTPAAGGEQSRHIDVLTAVLPDVQFMEIIAEDGDTDLLVDHHIARAPRFAALLNEYNAKAEVVAKIN